MARLEFDAYDFRLRDLFVSANGGHIESVRELAEIALNEVRSNQPLHPIVVRYLTGGLSEIASGGKAEHGFLTKRKRKTGPPVDPETINRQLEVAKAVAAFYSSAVEGSEQARIRIASQKAVSWCEEHKTELLQALSARRGQGDSHELTFEKYFKKHRQNAEELLELDREQAEWREDQIRKHRESNPPQ